MKDAGSDPAATVFYQTLRTTGLVVGVSEFALSAARFNVMVFVMVAVRIGVTGGESELIPRSILLP